MITFSGNVRTLAVVALMAAAADAWGQRLQFATPLSSAETVYQSPPAAAQFNGTIQGAPPFDPYADPAQIQYPLSQQATAAQYEVPQPVPEFGSVAASGWPDVPGAVNNSLRFLQGVNFHWTWIDDDGVPELDINEAELSATFAIPSFFYNNAPLLVTPGFGLRTWNGPVPAPGALAFPVARAAMLIPPDVPPQTYDAFLDFAWQPQVTPWMRADLGVRFGVFTDFDTLNSRSYRIRGRGLAVFNTSPTVEVRVGAIYENRLHIKMLPAGGVIWTPNPDARLEIYFPAPKAAFRFATTSAANWWWYAAAEYGGGTWTVERNYVMVGPVVTAFTDEMDYEDIRVMVGLERISVLGPRSYAEIGYVFDREVEYRSGQPGFKPENTFMLRAGVRY